MTIAAQSETLSFEAEVKQLLHLVTHSLYSNKEIFLRELISNASDAADKLRFEALSDPALYETDSDLKVLISFDEKAKTITISDNGIGYDQQNAEQIFHIFQRLHRKTEYSGTGIGLSICKKIVENHGGTIRATSSAGEDATFHIYLPIQ